VSAGPHSQGSRFRSRLRSPVALSLDVGHRAGCALVTSTCSNVSLPSCVAERNNSRKYAALTAARPAGAYHPRGSFWAGESARGGVAGVLRASRGAGIAAFASALDPVSSSGQHGVAGSLQTRFALTHLDRASLAMAIVSRVFSSLLASPHRQSVRLCRCCGADLPHSGSGWRLIVILLKHHQACHARDLY